MVSSSSLTRPTRWRTSSSDCGSVRYGKAHTAYVYIYTRGNEVLLYYKCCKC